MFNQKVSYSSSLSTHYPGRTRIERAVRRAKEV
jgi:hypothetical protein